MFSFGLLVSWLVGLVGWLGCLISLAGWLVRSFVGRFVGLFGFIGWLVGLVWFGLVWFGSVVWLVGWLVGFDLLVSWVFG